jgi:hypothetical protein
MDQIISVRVAITNNNSVSPATAESGNDARNEKREHHRNIDPIHNSPLATWNVILWPRGRDCTTVIRDGSGASRHILSTWSQLPVAKSFSKRTEIKGHIVLKM